MNPLYQDVLNGGRAPERAKPLLTLVEILYDSGYEDTLDEIETLVAINETLSDIVPNAESYICTCAEGLFNRLGMPITAETVYNRPIESAAMMLLVVSGIEEYEDYDSLLAVLASGETNEIILSNIASLVTGISSLDYIELMEVVEDRLLTIIGSTLNAKRISEQRDGDTLEIRETAMRVSLFMRTYPNSEASELLSNDNYLSTIDQLIYGVAVDAASIPTYNSDVAMMTAAIAIAKFNTRSDAQDNIENIAASIVSNDSYSGLLVIYRMAGNHIDKIFEALSESNE